MHRTREIKSFLVVCGYSYNSKRCGNAPLWFFEHRKCRKSHSARFHIFCCTNIRIPAQESSWSLEYDALMRDKIWARARARAKLITFSAVNNPDSLFFKFHILYRKKTWQTKLWQNWTIITALSVVRARIWCKNRAFLRIFAVFGPKHPDSLIAYFWFYFYRKIHAKIDHVW